MNIFLDLDGTLIDSRMRLYALYERLVAQIEPEAFQILLPFSEYWVNRRRPMPQAEMLRGFLGFSDESVERFKTAWMSHIEDEDLLMLDIPFRGVTECLRVASGRFSLYVVTARQHHGRVKAQLGWLGWDKLFSEILVTGQVESKAALIRRNVTISCEDIVVGDTAEDMVAARELGLRAVAVDSGFVSANSLQKYGPWRVYSAVDEFLLDMVSDAGTCE